MAAFCGLVAIACVGAFAEDVKPAAPAAPKVPRIAVVDLSRVYRSYAKADELQKKLDDMSRAFNEKEAGLTARIRQLAQEAESLSMGNPQREKVREELSAKQGELARVSDEANRQLDEALRGGMLEVYEDTVRTVTEYAKAHDIDIVLKQQTFEPNQPSAREQSIRIGQGNVLYCAPEYDITDAVIDRLNKGHEARKKELEKKE